PPPLHSPMFFSLAIGLLAASSVIDSSSSSLCPDPCYVCAGSHTCCTNVFGSWKCCPLESAVCCSDHKRCCPHGTVCNISEHSCESSLGVRGPPFLPNAILSFGASEMIPAVKITERP
ncbi:hypothetical protein PENTCL1PPCAC_27413, partial [Pristionchus entomophagus]